MFSMEMTDIEWHLTYFIVIIVATIVIFSRFSGAQTFTLGTVANETTAIKRHYFLKTHKR